MDLVALYWWDEDMDDIDVDMFSLGPASVLLEGSAVLLLGCPVPLILLLLALCPVGRVCTSG